jgi:hypothetical protein
MVEFKDRSMISWYRSLLYGGVQRSSSKPLVQKSYSTYGGVQRSSTEQLVHRSYLRWSLKVILGTAGTEVIFMVELKNYPRNSWPISHTYLCQIREVILRAADPNSIYVGVQRFNFTA